MQLRLATELTFNEYVKAQAWRLASLPCCPLCAPRPCRLERHGTYMRKVPSVAYVTRYYCPDQGVTFGLLPDFYASRMPGTLEDLEEVVARVEQARSVEDAANEIRPGDIEEAITLPAAIRWVRLRQQMVRRVLVVVMGLLPTLFEDCRSTVTSFRERLGTGSALVKLRGICERHLHALPMPLGLVPPPDGDRRLRKRRQQFSGPDPPRRKA